MIAITKGIPPAGLLALHNKEIENNWSPQKAYEKLKNPLKEQVRNQIIHEQGQLCAYCMSKIPRDDVEPEIAPIILEHYIPRNPIDGRSVHQGLDYNNLLAVCHGNRGAKGTKIEADFTCDAHRKNLEFRKVNPCQASTLDTIYYTLSGEIHASDTDVEYDLTNILNLNCLTSPLISERKAALDELITNIGSFQEDELLDICNSYMRDFEREDDPKTPYVGILLWYLGTIVNALQNE